MLGRWIAWTIVPPSDGPIFQQFAKFLSQLFSLFHIFCKLKKVKSNSLKGSKVSYRPIVLFPIYLVMIGPSDGGKIVQAIQRSSVLY